VKRFLLLLAACGDSHAASDAADQAQPCLAAFTGNFPEQSTLDANCPALATDMTGDRLLTFDLPSAMLGTSLAISIDLGAAPTPGTFSSETITTWNALAIQKVGAGDCAFSAGSSAVPTGSFTLAIDTIDATGGTAHGTLTILAYVLALLGTDGGAGDTETIQVMF
jgi:hypothetical protein